MLRSFKHKGNLCKGLCLFLEITFLFVCLFCFVLCCCCCCFLGFLLSLSLSLSLFSQPTSFHSIDTEEVKLVEH